MPKIDLTLPPKVIKEKITSARRVRTLHIGVEEMSYNERHKVPTKLRVRKNYYDGGEIVALVEWNEQGDEVTGREWRGVVGRVDQTSSYAKDLIHLQHLVRVKSRYD